MIRFNKIIFIILAFILAFSSLVYAKADSWYCKRTQDHSQPAIPEEFRYIEQYNGYYADRNHSNMVDNDKVVYLTFDAGYENGNISKTLDVLQKNNVCGSFFILSNLVDTSPDLVKRMSSEGHLVCNHTSKHPDVTRFTTIDEFKGELDALNKICYDRCGIKVSNYFRPPEGKFNEQTLNFANELGYKTIFWSFAYADWDNNNQPSKEYAKEKILSNLHNGAIILLHPTSKTNVDILDEVIKEIKAQGFRFASLDELC